MGEKNSQVHGTIEMYIIDKSMPRSNAVIFIRVQVYTYIKTLQSLMQPPILDFNNYPGHLRLQHICDTGAQNTSFVIFGFFYLVIFDTASASKYFLQNQNILFLTELMLLEQSKK